MNEEYLKQYQDIFRNSILIYQHGVTTKKIIHMVETDYLMGMLITIP